MGWGGDVWRAVARNGRGRRVRVEWLWRRGRPRWAVCGWRNRGVKERERKT
jgi:hypothetical protein